MHNKKKIVLFFYITLSLMMGVGIFNYIVDPYGLFRTIELQGFNQQKEGVRSKIRYVKSIEISLRKPKTIIMGSSRVHDGVNPEYIKEKSFLPVYNYGLDMARIKEIKQYLKHAVINSKIEYLILGLDYFMFNKYQRLNVTYDKTMIGRRINYFDVYFKTLFTMSALKDSIKTIKISANQNKRKEFLANGYRPGDQVYYKLKNYEKLHKNTNWIFLTTRPQDTLYYSKMALDQESLNDFQEIIKICKKHNIDLKLYISPAHASLDGEGINAVGLQPEFEKWKEYITDITNKSKVTLTDFSGYNLITTEAVRTPMKNYWDSSHFTESIGDMILDNILYSKKIDNFGIDLTPDNIKNHLKVNKKNRIIYLKSEHEYLGSLHEMYEKALNGDRQDVESLAGMF
jgi:hypothetical protein